MPSRLNMRHAAMVATVGILLLYQNCAQAPSDEGTNSQASYQESLPFGYKATLDTVSFMSCLDIQDPVEKRAYFTLRVGAYANQTLKTDGSQNAPSGLTMTDEFRAATSYYTATDRARSFSQSSKNAGARLSLSRSAIAAIINHIGRRRKPCRSMNSIRFCRRWIRLKSRGHWRPFRAGGHTARANV